uniref:Uncharacterized protein n=1 Tax=Pinguiococcus pyrenoidosus TaxID=172671 RepID=A0A7R9U828_9STRA
MREVADRAGLTAEGRNGMFHFLKTFGQREPASIGHADLTHYATLRVWRVFTIVDPSLAEEGRYLHQPRSDYLGESQPFSVPVADQLTMADIFNINRDLFDGTAFDLRFGLAAGPWGDPNRFDVCHDCPDPTLTEEDVAHGAFPRPISMFRTSYSQITVSRAAEPDFLAMAWVGQYAPHAGAYVPIYVITGEVPKPMATGHLFRYDPEVLYWCFAVVGNWARLMYIFIEKEIRDTRKGIEYGVRARQGGMEEAVKQIMHQADEGAYYVGKYAGPEHAAKVVQRAVRESVMVFSEYTDSCVDEYMTAWVKLYAYLIAKYHDGMVMHTTGGTDGKGGGVDGKGTIWMQKMFYPKKWLTAVGWFNSFWPDDPPGTPAGIPFPAPTIPPPSDNPTPAPVAESEAPTVSEETVAENTDTPVTQFPDEDFPTPREDTDDDSTQDYVQVVYSASDYTDTAEPSEGGGAPQEATTFVSGGGDSTSFPLVAISALWAMIGALVGFAFGRRSKIATSRAGQDPAWTRAMDQSKRYGAVEARA